MFKYIIIIAALAVGGITYLSRKGHDLDSLRKSVRQTEQEIKLKEKQKGKGKRPIFEYKYKVGDCLLISDKSLNYIKISKIEGNYYHFKNCRRYQGCNTELVKREVREIEDYLENRKPFGPCQ